jgi:hypothetical protein
MTGYNDNKKKSFVHRANKKRTSESDIPDKFRVMGYLKKHFAIYCVTDTRIRIPVGGHADYRLPDLFCSHTTPPLIILLHGGIHGFGDEISRRKKDDYALEDYRHAGNCQVIEIYKELSDNYSEAKIIQIMQDKGFELCQS